MPVGPVFTPPCGPVVGHLDGAVIRATGIPYAVAGRFEIPSPVDDWTVAFEANQPSPACPQPPSPGLNRVIGNQTGGLPESERCQNLSITIPANRDSDDLLPVMVWIHGGSYVSGAGDAPLYDASALVSEQNVIVVSITYRLGVLGYLGGVARLGNLGLRDQIAAFEWVHRNISAFGGDPARVTAFGQSAGADAIVHMMATPDARRLFTRAIIQSAPLGISRGRQKMEAAMSEAGASIDPDTPLSGVISAQAAVAAAAAPFGLQSAMAFGTSYGIAPLPQESSIEQTWNDVAPGIDILIGNTAQETRLFLPALPATASLMRVPLIGHMLASLVSRFLTEKVYARGARDFARRHKRAGGSALRYTITWHPKHNDFQSAHAIDVPLLFGSEATWEGISLLEGATWAEISNTGVQLRRLWASFARGDGLPRKGSAPGVLTYSRV